MIAAQPDGVGDAASWIAWCAGHPVASPGAAALVLAVPPRTAEGVRRAAAAILAAAARPGDVVAALDAAHWVWWQAAGGPDHVPALTAWARARRVAIRTAHAVATADEAVASVVARALEGVRPTPGPRTAQAWQVDLAAIVQETVPLKRQGASWVGRCPFHPDRTPSFHVWDPPQAHFHCFGCGAHGTVLDWWMRHDGLSARAARARLKARSGSPLPAAPTPPPSSPPAGPDPAWIPVYAAVFAALTLHSAHAAALAARGLDAAAIAAHQFRSLPPPAARAGWTARLGQSVAGVPGFSSRDGGRLHGPPGLLCPVRDRSGAIVGAQIRVDDPGEGGRYRWWSTPPDAVDAAGRPRYPDGAAAPALATLATPGARPWPLGEPAPIVWVTEGVLKAIVAAEHLGGDPVVGVPGAGQGEAGDGLVQGLAPRQVILAFDADAAGSAGAARAAARYRAWGLRVRRAVWDGVKGIDDALAGRVRLRLVDA